MGDKRPSYDWEKIEIEFRANKLSVREISRRYGPTETAIRKKARQNGWKRDLAQEVKARTTEKITRSLVEEQYEHDNELVEKIAERGAQVVETHRSDIRQARGVAGLLMQELHDVTEHNETLGELINQQADEEEWQHQRKSAAHRAISLPSRASVVRDLSTAMKTLQGLERTAFGIDGKETDRDPLDEILEAVSDTSRGVDGYGDE